MLTSEIYIVRYNIKISLWEKGVGKRQSQGNLGALKPRDEVNQLGELAS